MSRLDWKRVTIVLSWIIGGFLCTFIPIQFLSPQVGAPPGQRTLAIGPVWLSRLIEEVEGNTHRFSHDINWLAILPLVAVAGVIGLLRARAYREEP